MRIDLLYNPVFAKNTKNEDSEERSVHKVHEHRNRRNDAVVLDKDEGYARGLMVISGGSSGIGEACVRKYLANNYLVFNLDLADNNLLSKQEHYNYLHVDVTSEEQISKALTDITAKHKKIDVLIASAGAHLSATIENTSSEQLQALLNLNLLSVYWLIRYTVPIMKQHKNGSIVIIGSDQCSIAKPNSAVYGMTKAAVNHLAKSTALDYAKHNIRANCIGAGTVDTPLYRNAITRYSVSSGIDLAQIEEEEALQQPLGRVGKAEEIAELAYFLGQDNVSYITGALIPIDGGYIVR
ncbi:MAG TPA: SDR family oxidoreductase [Aquella sp.]|nr:SDR family oxidoreductase [Aquella sp.]